MFSTALIEAIAERDVHIREMLELKKLADKHGLKSARVETTLQGWVDEWIKSHPRESTILLERARLQNTIKESQR